MEDSTERKTAKLRAAVIGGANMDICGSPTGALVMRDSNPGRVTLRPGGVGRNIAHDLKLFGMEVSLITALGGDMNGTMLQNDCLRLGLDMTMSRILPDMRSSTYLYLTDETGDMLAAVNDMGITERITPEALAPLIERINTYGAVVADANLPERTLQYLAENCTAPMYADAVSAAKAKRLLPLLPKLRMLKPNMAEAETLTGKHTPEEAAAALLEAGVRQVYISMGEHGIYAAEKDRAIRKEATKTTVVNCNGAGDAATAAIVYACTAGAGLEEAAAAAVRAGAITVASAETNAEGLREVFTEERA